jgi:hypothetical protein
VSVKHSSANIRIEVEANGTRRKKQAITLFVRLPDYTVHISDDIVTCTAGTRDEMTGSSSDDWISLVTSFITTQPFYCCVTSQLGYHVISVQTVHSPLAAA